MLNVFGIVANADAIEREAADRRVAAGVKTLARRQSRDDQRLAVLVDERDTAWIEQRIASVVDGRTRKSCRQSKPRVAGEHHAVGVGQHAEGLRRQERFREAHLPPDRAAEQLGVGADVAPRGRLDLVVARVADDRAGKPRQQIVRECAIDEQPVRVGHARVEGHLGPLDLIASADADRARQVTGDVGAGNLALEVETGSNLLLDRTVQEPVRGGVEDARFPERADAAILRGRFGIEGMREAREETDRSVLAEHVAPPDLEERARRDFELLGRHAAGLAAPHGAQPALDAAAVADRGRRRFFDRHQQVARRLTAVAQLRDARAPEQAERRQAPLALVDRAEAEGIARFHLQLVLDGAGARPHVADDEHVIDEDLRPLANHEGDRHVRAVLAELGPRLDRGALVAEVLIRELNGVTIDRELARHVRRPRLQLHARAERRLAERLIPREGDAVDGGPRPLVDHGAHRDRHLRGRRRGRDGLHRGLDARRGEPAPVIQVLDHLPVGIETRLRERLAVADPQRRLELRQRHRRVAGDLECRHPVLLPARHREGDHQLAAGFLARV